MSKKIAILGYYNVQNLGDDLLARAFTRLLLDHRVVFFGFMPEISVLNTFDYIIIGGGSQWPVHSFIKNYRHIRKKLRTPFSLVGISSKSPIEIERTYEILEDARIVILRDQQSANDLHQHRSIRVAPDLTWLSPIPVAFPQTDPLVVGLNLRDWNFKIDKLGEIVNVIIARNTEISPLPFFEGHVKWEHRHTDMTIMEKFGLQQPNFDTLHAYRAVSIVVGMRFHSLVLAAQAGIPFIGFNYHPKIISFCNEFGLGDYCVNIENTTEFIIAFDQVLTNYTKIRSFLVEARIAHIERAETAYGALVADIDNLPQRLNLRSRLRIRTRLRNYIKLI